MGLPDKDMEVKNIFFYDFVREAVKVKETVRLLVIIREEPLSTTQIIQFMMEDQKSSHNALLG